MQKKISLLLISFLFLNACSVYRSQGRKQFDDSSGDRLSAFDFKGCQQQNAVSAWLQSEFPLRSYELILTETDLEVWQTRLENGHIEIKSIQSSENNRSTCTYDFASEATWLASQEKFLQDLSNNMMTAD